MKEVAHTLPMADSTTQGSSSGKLQTMAATSRIRSALATDEPPNFITTVTCTCGLYLGHILGRLTLQPLCRQALHPLGHRVLH